MNKQQYENVIQFIKLLKKQLPSDVDLKDAAVLVRILQKHTHTRFRLSRTDDKFWNDVIRYCDPMDGRITQLSLYGFDNNSNNPQLGQTFLTKLDKVERLELRDCRSLPIADLPILKSLAWLNVCILEGPNETKFLIPENRDWYPPNLKTFLIYGYKVKGDPLDALVATSIVMQAPPIAIINNRHNYVDISRIPSFYADNDVEEVLLSDGIGPFVKFDERSGRITELRLSSVVPNAYHKRTVGVDLPPTIGRLEKLRKLYLYNVCSIPEEISNLVNLRLLRLDGCSTFYGYPPNIQLPSVLDLQLRTCANCSILRWITSCFPSLRSLEILNVDKNSLENTIKALGKGRGRKNCIGSDCDQSPIRFRNSLVKLHLSSFNEFGTVISDLENGIFGILDNHPNLSKLYVERVAGIEDYHQNRIYLESLMYQILCQYPGVRGHSIGGRNAFSFDKRQYHDPCRGNIMANYPHNSHFCDIVMNLNRCGRVLLNPKFTSCNDCGDSSHLSGWIPASLWPRVLERAQRIPYAGTVRSKKDRTIQEVGALYFLLRNGPAFALRKQFGFEFVMEKVDYYVDNASKIARIEDSWQATPSRRSKRRWATRKRKLDDLKETSLF